MNTYLQQRVQTLLNKYDTAILATCGEAGPQISRIPYHTQGLGLTLFVAHGSDHLFNLETQHDLALLTPGWTLIGQGLNEKANRVTPPHDWQEAITVKAIRLHILSADGQHTIETIDF